MSLWRTILFEYWYLFLLGIRWIGIFIIVFIRDDLRLNGWKTHMRESLGIIDIFLAYSLCAFVLFITVVFFGVVILGMFGWKLG